jgi:Tol biopolymer transport system component
VTPRPTSARCLVHALTSSCARRSMRRKMRLWSTTLLFMALLVGMIAAAPVAADQHRPTTTLPSNHVRCRGTAMTLLIAEGSVYIANADGKHVRRVARVGWHPSWSPDGARIAFDIEGSGNFAPGDVYIVNADGSGERQLTHSGKGFDPEWSPNGKLIYIAGPDGRFVINVDGSGLRPVPESLFPAAWSPDGRRFVAVSKAGMALVNDDGSGRRLLVRASASGTPVWSPAGNRIAFETSGRRGTIGLSVINAGGTGRKLLRDHGQDTDATWSPDGTRLAFVEGSLASSTSAVYVIHADGSSLRRLTTMRDGVAGLTWSPDGAWLAFDAGPTLSSTAGSTYPIYLIKPDGTSLHDLSRQIHVGANDGDPRWKPCKP